MFEHKNVVKGKAGQAVLLAFLPYEARRIWVDDGKDDSISVTDHISSIRQRTSYDESPFDKEVTSLD